MEYRGHVLTYDQPGLWCQACGEGFFDDADMDVRDRALATLKAEAENVLPPAEVARIRAKLKLSQREAGKVLGGGINAFHKYEKGDAVISDAMANLLRLLDRHPAMLKTLERIRIAGGIKSRTGGTTTKAAFGIGAKRTPRGAAAHGGDKKRA